MFFQVWEKWYVQSEFPPFTVRAAWSTLALRVALQICIEKRPESGVFLVENWKHLGHWSGIVSYVSLSIKTTVEGRLKKPLKGNKTERDVSLSCTFYRRYFCLVLFYSNSFIFNCTFRTIFFVFFVISWCVAAYFGNLGFWKDMT